MSARIDSMRPLTPSLSWRQGERPYPRPRPRDPITNEIIEPCAAPEPVYEPVWHRRIYAAMALVVLAGYLFVLGSFQVYADGGPDENGYLVGGKMLAEHLSTRFDP